MLLSEFVKLPYSAKLLAMYLHVSNPTYKKLVTGKVVQRSVIIQITPKLKRESLEIIAGLETLKAEQQNFQPPLLSISDLSKATSVSTTKIKPDSNTFYLNAALSQDGELVVCGVKDSSTLKTRVNRSLYHGKWPQLEACPRDRLAIDELLAVSKYFGHKLPKTQALVFHNIHHGSFHSRLVPYLLTIAILAQRHRQQVALHFVIAEHFDNIDDDQLEATLNRFSLFLYQRFEVQTVILLDSADRSLSLQAADILARTLIKLPENEWPLRVVAPVKYETLASQPLFKAIQHLRF